MILALIILVPLCAVSLWVFFRFTPPKDKSKINLLYNYIVILIDVLLCAIHSYRMYATMINSVDRVWWPILSILGSLFIFPVILFVGAIIRAYIFEGK